MMSWRTGMRLPSTRMTWFSGSTRAPNRRTTCPSTSTRPAPISSSQCRLLPTPAAASTFCSRTPPGTSVRSSRSPSWAAKSSSSSRPMLRSARSRALASGDSCTASGSACGCASPGPLRPRAFMVLDVLDVLRQERRQLGQLVQGRHAQALEEVAGGAVQDRASLLVGPRVLDKPAQHERPDHAVAVDAAHRGDPGPANRLPVGDDRQGLQRRLGKPDFLAVPDEPLDERGAVFPSIEAPAARYLPQVEAAAVPRVLAREGTQAVGDLVPRALKHLGDQDFG